MNRVGLSLFLAAAIVAPGLVYSQQPPVAASPQAPARASSQAAPSPGIVEGMLAQSSSAPGYMDAAQVKAQLDQVRFSEYRINDLLTDVHPERWKMTDTARGSFDETVKGMRSLMQALDGWRAQFGARPESSYAGFETFSTIGAILPRLQGVAQTVSQADNASFGAQFFQAADRLFDLQQKLQPYVAFLLQNQDSISQALESDVAGCQRQLGQAMRGQSARPRFIRNSPPVRARRTRSRPASTRATPKPKDQ